MNLFDQNFSAKTLKAFSNNPEWTTVFARDALDALATHEVAFVVDRVFEVCNRTNSVDAVVAFFAVPPTKYSHSSPKGRPTASRSGSGNFDAPLRCIRRVWLNALRYAT